MWWRWSSSILVGKKDAVGTDASRYGVLVGIRGEFVFVFELGFAHYWWRWWWWSSSVADISDFAERRR